MIIRVVAIIVGALVLAACSSSSSWMDGLKPAPQVDNVRFESEPPGAEAKASNGQTCRTPCSLDLPVNTQLTVNFTLTGYEPATETLEPLELTGSPTTLRPNPVMVELTAAPPPDKKPTKKRAKKPAAKPAPKAVSKPAAKPTAKPAPAAAPSAPPPMQSAPQPAPAPAPWPATPPPQQQ